MNITENKKHNQRSTILDLLKKGEILTVKKLVYMNINSPTKRISELTQSGHPIRKTMIKGEECRYVEYSLENA